jgi:hypothetical protein
MRDGYIPAVWYSCCKSGKRWFWCVFYLMWEGRPGPEKVYGWEDTEEEAIGKANAELDRTTAGQKVERSPIMKGWASEALKEVNTARRAAKPPPNSAESGAVEYLYEYSGCAQKRYRITRKTKERIYYIRQRLSWKKDKEYEFKDEDYHKFGFIDRRRVFDKRGPHDHVAVSIGSKKYSVWRCLFTSPPPELDRWESPDNHNDLSRLKAEMAAAHPDKGGTCEAFIEARKRFVEARSKFYPGAAVFSGGQA